MTRSAAGLAVLAAAVVACGEVPAPRRCASAADCPADARCIQQYCAADAPPVAVITAPASFLSNVSYVFGSSGSYDTDAGDSVVSRQWTVTAAQASCQASPDAAATESVAVVFPCAGSFDVKLVVTDQLGVPSAPKVLRVSVTQSPDPPVLVMGADLALDHRCAGQPLVCTPVDALGGGTFALSASGTSPAGALAYKWRYELPPGLVGKPAPAVTFTPDDASPAPVVAVSTQGTAIAGEWAFVMEATDPRGLIAVGRQKVTVGNRPPEIQNAGVPLIEVPHVFNPSSPGGATGTMAALGSTPTLVVSDPDGDPVDKAFTSSHSGDGTNAFLVQDAGGRADFSVVVLYGGPADGAYLIGPGVSRAISFTATDVNGGASAASWQIQVTNHPPRLLAAVGALSVDHSFDAAGSRYLATATLSRFVDDDGDPLLPVAASDPQCRGKSVAAGSVTVECSVPYAGIPIANQLAGVHLVDAGVADAWQSATSRSQLTILNRPPVQTLSALTVPRTCSGATKCCEFDPIDKVCIIHAVTCPAAATSAPVPVDDPDGDPIEITFTGDSCGSASPGSVTCVSGSCPAETYSVCGYVNQCAITSTVAIAFTDGAYVGSGSLSLP